MDRHTPLEYQKLFGYNPHKCLCNKKNGKKYHNAVRNVHEVDPNCIWHGPNAKYPG